MTYTLADLAEHVGANLSSGHDCIVTGVATLQSAKQGDVSFLANSHYKKFLVSSNATAIVLSQQDSEHCSAHVIVCADPYLAFARIATLLHPEEISRPGLHATAVIAGNALVDPTASIGAHCVIESGAIIGGEATIYPGCVIGRNAKIGNNCRVMANVTIYKECEVGSGCLIHSGAVIGADGFGIAPSKSGWVKVPQLGRVIIGDDVEIGANTTIDRGALGDTVIGDGVKLDNLIQIAHNVKIGDHTAIAACTAIAGSTSIGRNCVIAGAVGIVGHLEIVDGVTVTAMSLVTKSLTEPGVYSSGWGAQPQSSWQRQVAGLRRLPNFMRRLRGLGK